MKDIVADVAGKDKNSFKLTDENEEKLIEVGELVRHAQSPLDRLVYVLHPWVSFFIMPLFAFVNSGIQIEGLGIQEFISHPVSLGVILGLLLGKPIGVIGASWLACKLGVATLPKGANWNLMMAVGFLSGIGFTMALFVSSLSFRINPGIEIYSKLGILTASALAATVGCLLLSLAKDQPN